MSSSFRQSSFMSSFHASSPHYQKYEIQIPKPSSQLVAGSLTTFVAFILLLFSFASPYWLVSWEYTFSPFKNMGIWEFCFKDYRHPNFQFDKLFSGCHYVFSEEYRIIREWLLPGWLMCVQAFVTLAFMCSITILVLLCSMVTRWPLQLVIDNECFLTIFVTIGNAVSSFLMFLSIVIFGGQCYRRDWIQYPNFNYLSWGYAFSVISMFVFAFAALILHKEYKDAKERQEEGDGHLFQMHQPAGNGEEVVGGLSNPSSEVNQFV